MAVAAHRARLPLSFFHQIPSPPCHQPSRPALPTTPAATVGAATSNNASERRDLNPALLPGEGDPRYGGGAGGGANWPPSPGTSAVGLYQGDGTHAGGRLPAENTGGLEQGEATRGKGTERKRGKGSGAGVDLGTVCVWKRCRVKGRAAVEERHAGDAAVVVEWDDEVGGQVRREDFGAYVLNNTGCPSAVADQSSSFPWQVESTALACHACTHLYRKLFRGCGFQVTRTNHRMLSVGSPGIVIRGLLLLLVFAGRQPPGQ